MSFINASRLAEFLDDRKNEPLDRLSLRTDIDLLRKAGVSVSENSRKFGRRIRTLEYFLLRSHLYRSEGNNLIPHYISSNWSDYAKAWKTKVDGDEIHIPFLGKMTFICKTNGTKKAVCHPDTAAMIEKICIDTGKLTFQKDPDNVNLMYKPKTCNMILERYDRKKLTEEFLQYISNTTFGRALASIDLARREGASLRLMGDSLLLDEIEKIKGEDELEKVARVILRREQKKQAQIASVVVCLEYLERQVHPSEKPIGEGQRYRKSKRTKKRYESLDHYEVIEGICSIDARAASNVLAAKGTRSPGFASFGAFIDTYYNIKAKFAQNWVENYSFLSWYTDSLAHLTHSSENLGNKLDWPDFKNVKTRRHKDFLTKSVRGGSLRVTDKSDLLVLQSKCKNTEFIDMNIDPNKIPQLKDCSHVEYCFSNVFATSKVPVNRGLFESSVLKILQSPSKSRDPQGAFYYPDFRFLVASTLGLSLESVDQILAYVLSKGSDLGRRLWFFPAFGKVPRRDSPDRQLVDVVRRPFDSITLNY